MGSLTSQNREDARAVSDALRAQANETLRARTATVGLFVERVTRLFTGMAEGRTYQRRPNVSLRLVAAGDPPGKLVTVPSWDAREKALRLDNINCEWFTEQKVETAQGPGWKFTRRASFWNRGGAIYAGSIWRNPTKGTNCLADYGRMLDAIREFLDDSAAVLARSRERCCICGRKLTDGKSMARGIGPECLEKASFLLLCTPTGLVPVGA